MAVVTAFACAPVFLCISNSPDEPAIHCGAPVPLCLVCNRLEFGGELQVKESTVVCLPPLDPLMRTALRSQATALFPGGSINRS